MCRCEHPRWRELYSGPKVTMAECATCGAVYHGCVSEAQEACHRWQAFFIALNMIGITSWAAQHHLWGLYKDHIQGGALDPRDVGPYVSRFMNDLAAANLVGSLPS